jgi:hypothetical protein
MTQRAIDLSKGVLPVGLVVALVLGAAGAIYESGRRAEKLSQIEEMANAAPTAADLEKLSGAIADLDQRLAELKEENDDVAAIKNWMIAVYERASAHGWDLPPLPQGVQDEHDQKKAVQSPGAARGRGR